MLKKYAYDGLTWIDLESPSYEEIREVMETYNIDPLVAEELVSPSLRPKVDLYPNCIYLILHFPDFKNTRSRQNNQEIDFILGKKVLITTRYDNIDPLHNFSKIFEVNSILEKSKIGDHAGFIFFYMMRNFYHALADELDYIKETLTDVEENIFSGKERDMVTELSVINRKLLAFKEAINVHKDVLNSFEAASKKFFGDDFDYYNRSIIGEYYRVQGAVDSSKEYLDELRDTNDSLLSTKQNEIMKRLTVATFIFLPLSFIAAVFGMSMDQSFIHTRTDFWTILLSMIAVGIGLSIYFKKKNWF